jgi:hypothetical protein
VLLLPLIDASTLKNLICNFPCSLSNSIAERGVYETTAKKREEKRRPAYPPDIRVRRYLEAVV